MAAAKRRIVIDGDVTVDWMFKNPGGDPEGVDFPEIWGAGFECGACAQPGGAAMLTKLVSELTRSNPALASTCEVTGPTVSPRALSSPHYRGLDRTWTSWSLHPSSLSNRSRLAWRIDGFWGQSCHEGRGPSRLRSEQQRTSPDYLVIDDADLGYRDQTPAWSHLLAAESPEAVLIKMTAPLATGPLWTRLLRDCADVLTVVVPINDVRKSSAQIGDPLSWERTASEVQAAVRATELVRAARVVVNIGPTGALLLQREGDSVLVFDPLAQQGDWEQRRPGLVMGYATCMCAALLHDLLHDGHDPVGAAERALQAMRFVHESGYEEIDRAGRPSGARGSRSRRRVQGLCFPYKATAAVMLGEAPLEFARASLEDSIRASHSFLTERLGSTDLTAAACAVARGGPACLPAGIPIETVGAWSSIDRSEIEGVRAVRNIVAGYAADYERGRRLEQPLSIAVFGPPGAGKSFAVKQIAKALLRDRIRTCEFNLSEFSSEEKLLQAFHQVRDLALRQFLPLVFWDEFDTPLNGFPLGWLRFFLAPMQDGEFRAEDAHHPIGPAVFVFAGGTSRSLREFAAVRDAEAEKAAKKPDFLSRLRGYMDVFGPNPHGPDDVAYMLRRALLLRSLVGARSPRLLRDGILQIDEGVLRAFVCADRFRHGARSMQAIVEMSSLSGKLHFDRSSLPPEDQLDLHVDGRLFGGLVEGGL
ncbi:MAG TPA: ATP-binding protein [Thermoleophilia bacterium]|nr:ATP-binding protein [Thermoleophilia bacterium]